MRRYFNTTSAYLLGGGCAYQVSAVYQWNVASWDVIGASEARAC